MDGWISSGLLLGLLVLVELASLLLLARVLFQFQLVEEKNRQERLFLMEDPLINETR